MSEVKTEALSRKLDAMLIEHRDLDSTIDRLSCDRQVEETRLKLMKKRKLWLKDKIERLSSQIKTHVVVTAH